MGVVVFLLLLCVSKGYGVFVNEVDLDGCTSAQCLFLQYLAPNQMSIEDQETYHKLPNLEAIRCFTCTQVYGAAYMIVPRNGNLTEIHSRCLFTEDVDFNTPAHPIYRLVLYPSGCHSSFNFWFCSSYDVMYLDGDQHYPFSLNIGGRLLIPGRMLTWYNGTSRLSGSKQED